MTAEAVEVTDENPAASRRSKLTPEREQEFYEAVLDQIRRCGYDALTMEGIALRTRCSKSTLYRQWRTKQQFVAAALRARTKERFSGIDTGSLAGDLLAAAHAAGSGSFGDTLLVQALTQAALHDPDLKKVLRETLVDPELAAIGAMLDRGVARGELRADHPARPYVASQLLGVLRMRTFIDGKHADTPYMECFVRAVLLPVLGLEAPEATGERDAGESP
ncbi:TetR/AcrR family transcriptional regulator [Streptomyces sp. NPDC088674]|uniref:TetR/AcrR family transcriptional regulator n=1 Tax=Streptomyces sp. NPDC088674 TaxID=3365869 RepID=UPI0037FF79BD